MSACVFIRVFSSSCRSHGYLNHSGRSVSSTTSTSSDVSDSSTGSDDSGVSDMTSSMSSMSMSHSYSSEADMSSYSSIPSPRRSSVGISNMEYSLPDERDVMKYAHITNEHVRLNEVIDRMDPEQLKAILKKNLKRKEQKNIIAMSMLFPRKNYPQIQRVHCVRCHKEYEVQNNHNCVIRHPNACVLKTSQDTQGANFRCRACGQDFRLNNMFFYNESVNSHLSGFCYSGSHTHDPRQVKYHSAIRTCEETGCVEYYV